MRIAFNPSTVAALIAPPNNKDITFDLRGQNIFARGVKFCGTDTNTWRDIKINNVSIGTNTLDLRDGSNTTLTNINGVVTINSTWRPVVDNLTSDSTTSSLSANLGRVLKALIDGKSDSGHNHDDRYYTKAESNAKYITDITTSINKLTFTKNGSNIDRDIRVNNVLSLGRRNPLTERNAISGIYTYGTYSSADNLAPTDYFETLGFGEGAYGTIEIGGSWISGGKLYWRALRDCCEDWFSWKTILDSSNYSGILDSRYYTESEVNNLLSKKLNTSDFNWTNLPDKIVAGNEFNIVNAGFNSDMYFNYLPINDRSKTASIHTYIMCNGAEGMASIKASGFIKNGSSSSYVLLGDGGHQTISSLSVNYASSAGYANGIANKGLLDSQEKIDNFITANRLEYATFKTTESNNVGFDANDGMILSIPWDSTKYGAQIAFDDAIASTVKVRSKSGSWGNWHTLLHSGNYNSYSPTLTGAGASGTWGINITGNADTVDGYHATMGSNKPWGTIPVIHTSGWMDIGKQLEFHFDNTTGSDYSTVLRCTGNYGNNVYLPSSSGTLALTSDIPTTLPANGGNADTVDGYHASSFVRAGHYESADLNNLDTYSFIRSVNSNNKDTSPKGDTGWYNVILLVHRNGDMDGPGYIGLIVLGMTTNTNDMFFRGKRTDPWKMVIHSGNIGNQTVASATKLQTARLLWGQSFDGTGDVSGTLSGVANILFSADNTYDIGSNSAASRYIYTYWLGAKSGLKLELGANDSNFGLGLCIDTNLNVGIGTNTPAYKLHVAGDIYTTTGFKKNGSNDFYVLLGGGGHKLESSLNVAHANTSGLSWDVLILGQHWSRLFAGIPNIMHHSSIFSISGSIGCVVFCLTFLVESNHSGSATIICLFSSSYTQPKMRALAKSDGTVLVDLYWDGSYCGLSSSTQQMTINVIANVLLGSISPITSLTNDDTIPSGYSNTCEFLCASKTSNFYNVSLHTLGVNNIATFNINNQWLTPSVLQIGRIDGSQNESKAVIGVTNGNLHIDAYHGKKLYLNFYNRGQIRLGYQTGSYYISEDGSYYSGTVALAGNADTVDGYHATDGRTFNGNINWSNNWNDAWSDGTNNHPWYGFDHRYPNTGAYSTTISDFFGMTIKTANTLRLDFRTLLLNGTSIYDIKVASSGKSTIADSANKLNKWFDSRVTTLNHLFGDGALRIFHATSSVTDTTKCPSDATILHLAWDNNEGWDSLLAVGPSHNTLYFRGLNNYKWNLWQTVLHDGNSSISGNTIKINNTSLTVANYNHNHDNVYLKLAGGTMLDLSRIGVNGDLYIGDADNRGWIYFQDIASLDGTDYWTIQTDGSAEFEDIITRSSISVGGLIYRGGIDSSWNKGRDNALLRDTSSNGYHALWSLKTTNGSWEFGEYNNPNWYDVPVLSYITDSNYNSGNNITTYQIKFPLASGTVALTSNIPNPTDYYWANIKISSTDNIMTLPLFYSVKAYQYSLTNTNGSGSYNLAYLYNNIINIGSNSLVMHINASNILFYANSTQCVDISTQGHIGIGKTASLSALLTVASITELTTLKLLVDGTFRLQPVCVACGKVIDPISSTNLDVYSSLNITATYTNNHYRINLDNLKSSMLSQNNVYAQITPITRYVYYRTEAIKDGSYIYLDVYCNARTSFYFCVWAY